MPPGSGPRPKKLGRRGSEPLLHSVVDTEVVEVLDCFALLICSNSNVNKIGDLIMIRTDEEILKTANESVNMTDFIRKLGLKPNNGSIEKYKKRLLKLNFQKDDCWINYVKPVVINKRPIDYYLVLNCETKIGTSLLKHRLYDEGLKNRQCEGCGLKEWLGEPIPLELEHVDGNNKNNQFDNLKILCRNCHGLTSTHSKQKKSYKHERICQCGNDYTSKSKSKLCAVCSRQKNADLNKKIFVSNKPTYDVLIKEVSELGYCAVGRKYGVSDNSIRKWIKKYNFDGASSSDHL